MNQKKIDTLKEQLLAYGTGPLLSEMPRNTLEDKGIAGPTAAHRIEELHTPLNLAYVTFTTGSSAFQNMVGVTHQELPERIRAGKLALALCGVHPGDEIVVAYPPLVNVFCNQVFQEEQIRVRFLHRPSRDALLLELCSGAGCVIGESSFLCATLQEIQKMGLQQAVSRGLTLIASGTPLRDALLEEAARFPGAVVHDLYGCQEFGWLALDGVPLRPDVQTFRDPQCEGWHHLIVGGLPTGDMVPEGAHPLNPKGRICTPAIKRAGCELETVITAGTAGHIETMQKAARTILRIKSKLVYVSEEFQCGAPQTKLYIAPRGGKPQLHLRGPESTRLLDDLIAAQKMYQRMAKNDPVWSKLC